jgi:E3 ubiquitin-protein ligase HERC4
VNELTINEELSHKQIIDFKNSSKHVIARTIHGAVSCWDWNWNGVLGNGKNDKNIYKPELNDKQIIDICCGFAHSLVLTNRGGVHAWGYNSDGQIGNERNDYKECQLIPIKVNGFNDEKVIQISCGGRHSMALTESSRVLSWGDNSKGQLGVTEVNKVKSPTLISIRGNRNLSVTFNKTSCSRSHSLLLSNDGVIYAFGNNNCGQLGIENSIE